MHDSRPTSPNEVVITKALRLTPLDSTTSAENAGEARIKEEPISEDEEEPMFKRVAKIKAGFYIRKLAEKERELASTVDINKEQPSSSTRNEDSDFSPCPPQTPSPSTTFRTSDSIQPTFESTDLITTASSAITNSTGDTDNPEPVSYTHLTLPTKA